MTTNPTPRSAFKHPATVLAAAALAVAVGGSAITAQADPVATGAKALGTKKLTVRKAGVEIPGGRAKSGDYNSRSVAVQCPRGEVALSVSTQFPGAENAELVTRYARLTVNRRGKPTGAVASGATDVRVNTAFEVQVLCAG